MWNIVRRSIPPQTTVHVLAIPDAEPEIKVVMHGVETLKPMPWTRSWR